MTANPMAHSVEAAADRAGVGRTTIYAAIRDGALVARKCGRRTIVLTSDLQAWLSKLPHARASSDENFKNEGAHALTTRNKAVDRQIRNNFGFEPGGDND